MMWAYWLLRITSVTIILCLYSIPALSQEFWRAVNGPHTGTFRAIAINQEGHIFAGPIRSMDNGASWSQPMGDNRVYALAINSQGHIFAGTNSDALLRSTDGGDNWSRCGLNNPWIKALAINSSDHVFAGTYGWGIFRTTDNCDTWVPVGLLSDSIHVIIMDEDGIIYAGTANRGVFRSVNNGDSWDHIGLSGSRITSITLGEDNTIIACTDFRPYGTGFIYQSPDTGETWQPVLSGYNFFSLATDHDGTIYAGSYNYGIFSSNDNGSSWSQLGLEYCTIKSIAFNDEGIIWAGTLANGLKISADNGLNWTTVGPFTPKLAHICTDSSGVIYTGSDPDGVYRSDTGGENWTITRLKSVYIFDMTLNSVGDIFVSCYNEAVFRSLDYGANWDHIMGVSTPARGIGVHYNDDIYLGIRQSESYRSIDNGDNWIVQADCYNIGTFAFSPTGYIYARSEYGIFRSIENTDTWEQVADPPGYETSLNVNSNGEVFAGTELDGLYLSIDNGDSWDYKGFDGMYIYEVAINSDDVIVVATGDDGVFASVDNGTTWIQFNSGLACEKVRCLGFTNDNHILACNWTPDRRGAMFKSTYAFTGSAEVWPGDMDNNGIVEALDIIPLVENWYVDVPPRLYSDIDWTCYSYPMGEESIPFQSDADGSGRIDIQDFHAICGNWDRTHGDSISAGYNIADFDVEANRDVIGLIYNQVKYADSGPLADIRSFIERLLNPTLPERYQVFQNYPNPFNSSTVIRYDVPKDSDVEIVIYNVLGQKVKQLIARYHNAGKYETAWNSESDNGAPVSSGIYYYIFSCSDYSEVKSMTILK
ncbi:MAG: T9SS type A sorting domain-containing protein [candidate division Zixibacteria bacterium]|nr:T9SS type A sorting domain-containing protein [candidate division Zixibacteria bacterium]